MRLSTFALITLLLIIALSCSSPLEPENEIQIQADSTSSRQFFGYYTWTINTSTGEIETVPVRNADVHLNVTGVLNGTMGLGVVPVPSEADPPNGKFAYDVTLTHPFANPLYCGFDVKGILLTPGTYAVGPLMFAGPDETQLENADGYTRWWNPTEFTSSGLFGYTKGNFALHPNGALTATINPYKYFADILDATTPMASVQNEPVDAANGRGIFRSGASNTRRYIIQFEMDPGPQVVFGYAIDASWTPPSVNPPLDLPNDFPPSANQPEAYNIVVAPTFNTMFYDVDNSIGGGELNLKINVHDWQGQIAGIVAPEVDTVRVFAPDLWDGGVTADFLEDLGTKVSYTADFIPGISPPAAGTYPVFVRAGSSGNTNYTQNANPAPDAGISTWQVIYVDVEETIPCEFDVNNQPKLADPVGLDETVTEHLCHPQDTSDFYTFTIGASQSVTGTADIYIDSDNASFDLRVEDNGPVLIEVLVVDGHAQIDVTGMDLPPANYVLGITSAAMHYQPYVLDMNLTAETISFGEISTVDTFGISSPQMSIAYIEGTTLLLMNANDLLYYDISDPTNPVLTNEYLEFEMDPEEPWNTDHWPYFYYITKNDNINYSLNVWDFSDIENPVQHLDLAHPGGQITGVFIKPGTDTMFLPAYRPILDDRCYTYDITDPINPVQSGLDFISIDHETPAYVESGGDDYLIVVDGTSLRSYDISNPNLISQADSIVLNGTPVYRSIGHGDKLFLEHEIAGNSISAFSVSSIGDFFIESNLNIEENVNNWYVEGEYIYTTTQDKKIQIINVSVIDNIGVSATINTEEGGQYVVTSISHLFHVRKGRGLEVYDISTPTSPSQVFEENLILNPQDVVIVDNFAIISDSATDSVNRIVTLDITDPENPMLVGEYPLDQPCFDLVYSDGLLFADEQTDIVQIFDALDPTSLSLVSSADFNAQVFEFGAYKDVLWVTGFGLKIESFDISDPPNPVLLWGDFTNNFAGEPHFYEDTMYIPTSAGIEVWDITDPSLPVGITTYVAGGISRDIDIAYGYMYVAADNTFEIVSLFDPISPMLVGSTTLDPGDFAHHVYRDGPFAYLGPYDDAKLYAMNIVPDMPEIGTDGKWAYSFAYGLAADNQYIFVPSSLGLRIFNAN